jgi:hypothetical protein
LIVMQIVSDKMRNNSDSLETISIFLAGGMLIATSPETGGKCTTERDKMETSETAEYIQISCENSTYNAAVCHRCGTKIFPVELLDAHLDRHQIKDLYLEGELKKLQFAMARMR